MCMEDMNHEEADRMASLGQDGLYPLCSMINNVEGQSGVLDER